MRNLKNNIFEAVTTGTLRQTIQMEWIKRNS